MNKDNCTPADLIADKRNQILKQLVEVMDAKAAGTTADSLLPQVTALAWQWQLTEQEEDAKLVPTVSKCRGQIAALLEEAKLQDRDIGRELLHLFIAILEDNPAYQKMAFMRFKRTVVMLKAAVTDWCNKIHRPISRIQGGLMTGAETKASTSELHGKIRHDYKHWIGAGNDPHAFSRNAPERYQLSPRQVQRIIKSSDTS